MEEKKILIVEDVRAARHLYEQALLLESDENYEIKGVDRGAEALRALKTDKYELVILDINLPDMGGEEVLSEIRKNYPDMPVLILTAIAEKNTIIKITKEGINDYLIKPVDLKVLRQRVQEIVVGDRGIILKENPKVKKERKKEVVEEADRKYVWTKQVVCPVCAHEFESYNYRIKSQALVEKESDFHEIYEKFDPVIYDVVVCPECYYANVQVKFGDLKAQYMEMLQQKERKSTYDFTQDRNLTLGLESINLAVLTLEQLEVKNSMLYGNLYLKKAWIYRNMKDELNENENLRKAMEYYEEKYLSADNISGGLSENGVAYLVAELARRTKDPVKAQKYFNIVISSQEAKKEKYIYGLAKRQYRLMKDEM